MKTRLLTGIPFAAFVVFLIFKGSVEWVSAAVLITAAIAYVEFDKMFFTDKSLGRQAGVIVLLGATMLAMAEDMGLGFFFFFGSFILLCSYHVVTTLRGGDFQKTARTLALQLIGYIYVLSLLGFVLPIIKSFNGQEYLLLLFLIVFLGDTVAYFVGRSLGKNKLAPAISPKKTIEGSMGAILASAIVGALWLRIYPDPWDTTFAYKVVYFAPVLSILAQLGDLFESLLKRSQDHKDSGSILPGHGGILDRIDGLSFSSPAFYVYMIYVLERGV
jgi:phosphatidate cytidylyltransferase